MKKGLEPLASTNTGRFEEARENGNAHLILPFVENIQAATHMAATTTKPMMMLHLQHIRLSAKLLIGGGEDDGHREGKAIATYPLAMTGYSLVRRSGEFQSGEPYQRIESWN